MRNGPNFEMMIRARESDNPTLAFLFDTSSPGFAYYQKRVAQLQVAQLQVAQQVAQLQLREPRLTAVRGVLLCLHDAHALRPNSGRWQRHSPQKARRAAWLWTEQALLHLLQPAHQVRL